MSWSAASDPTFPVFRSLRFRLATGYVLGLALVLLGGAALFHARTKAALEAEADTLLRLVLHEPAQSMRDGDKKPNLDESIPDRQSPPVALRILDGGGHVVSASSRTARWRWPIPLPLPARAQTTVLPPDAGADALRVLTVPVEGPSGDRYYVQAATPWGAARETLRRQDAASAVAVPLLLLIAGIGAWTLVGRALSPVDRIAAEAARISEENLSQRLSAPMPDDELGRLVGTLNGMIGRLDAAFRAQRRFTADASHELRTPLAALRGRLEVLGSRRRTDEEYEDAIPAALLEIDRMARIVADLLSLARAEVQAELPEREPVSLGQLAEETAVELGRMAAEKSLTLQVAADRNAVLLGDAERLRRLVRNLVENALKYTPAGGDVRVTVLRNGGDCVLTVSDTGIGIAEEELPRVFERFYRADTSRARGTGGIGLGLAIAAWVVRTHQGTLDVQSSVGVGTTFTARLPVVPPGADEESADATEGAR